MTTTSRKLRRAVATAFRRNGNGHRALRAIFCCGGRSCSGLLGPAVHLLHDEEYGKRDDQEIDHRVQEEPIIQRGRTHGLGGGKGFIGFIAQVDE